MPTQDQGSGATEIEKVEIKFNVSSDHIVETLSDLELSELEETDVYFLETKDRDLQKKFIILRVRDRDIKDDVTVKIRDGKAANIMVGDYEKPGEKLDVKKEGDWVIDGDKKISFSITDKRVKVNGIGELASSGELGSLFHETQKELIEDIAGSILWKKLLALGPVKSRKWDVTVGGIKLNLEEWSLSTATVSLQMLEFSKKVDVAEAEQALVDIREALLAKGIKQDQSPESKTEVVIRAFLCLD
jgi:hypothetical protein